MLFHIARAQQTALRIKMDQISDRDPHLQNPIGVAEHLFIIGIPADQAQVAVHHTDRRRHTFKRRHNHVLIKTKSPGAFFKDIDHILNIQLTLFVQRFQKADGRRDPNHARQRMLSSINQLAGGSTV